MEFQIECNGVRENRRPPSLGEGRNSCHIDFIGRCEKLEEPYIVSLTLSGPVGSHEMFPLGKKFNVTISPEPVEEETVIPPTWVWWVTLTNGNREWVPASYLVVGQDEYRFEDGPSIISVFSKHAVRFIERRPVEPNA